MNTTTIPANPDQSVVVAAGNMFHDLMVAAAVAGGEVGVGASVGVGLVTINTDASIGTGPRWTPPVTSSWSRWVPESLISVVITAAGGEVGVAGAASVLVLNMTTHAETGTGVVITAGNNILVAAQDSTSLIVVAGGVAGGVVGVGVGVAVTSITKNTQASIGAGSTVTAYAAEDPSDQLADVYNGDFHRHRRLRRGPLQRPGGRSRLQ